MKNVILTVAMNSTDENGTLYEEYKKHDSSTSKRKRRIKSKNKEIPRSVDWIAKLKQTASSQNYVSTVLKLLSLDELRVIAMCYRIKNIKKHTAEYLRHLLLNYNTKITLL